MPVVVDPLPDRTPGSAPARARSRAPFVPYVIQVAFGARMGGRDTADGVGPEAAGGACCLVRVVALRSRALRRFFL